MRKAILALLDMDCRPTCQWARNGNTNLLRLLQREVRVLCGTHCARLSCNSGTAGGIRGFWSESRLSFDVKLKRSGSVLANAPDFMFCA